MPETPVAFDGVEMLNTSGLGHTFRIGIKDVFVGSAVPLKGTTVVLVGQVGRLVLPRWFVEQENIEGGQMLPSDQPYEQGSRRPSVLPQSTRQSGRA